MTMHRVIMTVHHGKTYRVEGRGETLEAALDAVLETSVGAGYGPSSEFFYTLVYEALEDTGKASRGWATYEHEVYPTPIDLDEPMDDLVKFDLPYSAERGDDNE